MPLSFFKSFWFIKAGMQRISCPFLVTTHKNENTMCDRSLWGPQWPSSCLCDLCPLCDRSLWGPQWPSSCLCDLCPFCDRSLWAPSGPHHACVICAPWVWAGPGGLLLMKRGRQKWWDVTSKIRSQKDLLASCSCSLALSLPCSDEASCHTVSSCKERSTCNWERPLVNRLQGTKS